MESHHHLSKAWKYNKEWEAFFEHNPSPTIERIEQEAKRIMQTVYEYEY